MSYSQSGWTDTTRGSGIDATAGNLNDTQRTLSATLGGAALMWGWRHGGPLGGLAQLLGAGLVARSFAGYCPVTAALSPRPQERLIAQQRGWQTAAEVRRSVTIAREPAEVYRFLRNFSNLPRFMSHIESVNVRSPNLIHWVVRAPAGTAVEMDTRIVEDRPNERIAWESEPGAAVPNAGSIEFRHAAGGGTELHLHLTYEPPAGQLGRVIAKLWGEEPGDQAQDNFERLKHLLESGQATSPTATTAATV